MSPESCPGLALLCGAYFHQDWMEDSGSPQGTVESFVCMEHPSLVSRTLSEVRMLLASPASEQGLQELLDDWGCEYYIPGDGLTPRRWLRQLEGWLSPPVRDPIDYEMELD